MSERISAEIVKVNPSNPAVQLLPKNREATKCDFDYDDFMSCPEFDMNSFDWKQGPHSETLKSTKIGVCKLTKKPCLMAAESLANQM